MNWIPLTEIGQLNVIDEASYEKPVLIFKHSTRCSISGAALGRLERAWTGDDDAAHAVYFLDLLRYRPISNGITERYGIEHESPQAIVISGGKSVRVDAHFGIGYETTITALRVQKTP
ncbi:MAG: bacillithiol system redox-active protein YtxJ [Flavobacteriales bacterium]|nr:bacillithiol system redox-active protein YtxJ [Flavobacteriales bacterium]